MYFETRNLNLPVCKAHNTNVLSSINKTDVTVNTKGSDLFHVVRLRCMLSFSKKIIIAHSSVGYKLNLEEQNTDAMALYRSNINSSVHIDIIDI